MRRQPTIFTRALLSGAATLLLTLVFLIPARYQATTEAHPLEQATAFDTPTITWTPIPPAPSLSVQDPNQSVTTGTSVLYSFTLSNVGGTGGTFRISILPGPGGTVTGVTVFASTSSIGVDPNNAQPFQVTVFVPASSPAGVDTRIVRATSASDPSKTSDVLITTTISTATPTPTNTPTETATPSPTTTTTPTGTAGPVCQDDFEYDGNIANAKEIHPDVAQTHAICPRGDEDWMFFGGISGKVYTIDVPAMKEGLDLSLGLYDSQGNLLAFNDDFPRGNDASDIKPRIQSFRIPANGRYYIRVRDNAGSGGTDLIYNVILSSESFGPTPTLIPELCTDRFEPDGVPEQARLIVIRETQPDHTLCPSGDADWVRFFAKTGARYALRVDSKQRPGADPVMVLTDRDGVSILDFSDDTGGTLDPRIEFSPQVDGFYFAQIKNVGDIGNQFISYDLFFDPISIGGGTPAPEITPTSPPPAETPAPTETGTGTTGTVTPTETGTAATETPTDEFPTAEVPTDSTPCDINNPEYPICLTPTPAFNRIGAPKGQPKFVNGPAKAFVDPAFGKVWSHTDQPIASKQANRSWMWGPTGLVGRAEMYDQSNGGVRQVQYFDKARMEITDWNRNRSNPWFVTNGLLVRELVEGRMQVGDATFLKRTPAQITIAGDADDGAGPTYASFTRLTGRVDSRVGKNVTEVLLRNGSTTPSTTQPAIRLAYYVPETGHNIAQVFWDFLQTRGPVGDGKKDDLLVDWIFAMGYPISEPYWTHVKVGGVEKDVLVQAFQRRVLTYTPANPKGWQVEMGNAGRHYYQWRYGKQP